MSKSSQHQEAIEAELVADPRVATYVLERRGSGHYGYRFYLTNGHTGLFIATSTPSDHRSFKNDMRDLRRSIREAWERQ